MNGALDHVRRECDGDVLIVSSGGPISTAIGQVLGTPHASTIDINMRIRNSAVSELIFTPQRHMLLTYNTLPHLDGVHDAGLGPSQVRRIGHRPAPLGREQLVGVAREGPGLDHDDRS